MYMRLKQFLLFCIILTARRAKSLTRLFNLTQINIWPTFRLPEKVCQGLVDLAYLDDLNGEARGVDALEVALGDHDALEA